MKRTLFLLWLLIAALLLALFIEANVHHIKIALPLGLNQKDESLASSSNLQAQADVAGSYVVTGKPTITAAFINQVLSTYHSPTARLGQVLYNDGVKYGIDPAFALAWFLHESTFGRYGMAATTLSLGNLRCLPAYPCIRGYAAFASWQQGFAVWYYLIRDLYVGQWHLRTVAQIVPMYAPAKDHNNVAAYIAAIERAVDTWRSGKVVVS